MKYSLAHLSNRQLTTIALVAFAALIVTLVVIAKIGPIEPIINFRANYSR